MMSAANFVLKKEEEGWRETCVRLSERFPSVKAERILEALRSHDGHAGSAAAELRDLTSSTVKPPDPDDAEHVATLLSSPMMFKHACKEQFHKFDVNGDGSLDFPEVLELTRELYNSFGLKEPSEATLKAFFFATDDNNDGVLSEREFRRFFEMFLRYAFFDVVKLQQLVDKATAEGVLDMYSRHASPAVAVAVAVAPAPAPAPALAAERSSSQPRASRQGRKEEAPRDRERERAAGRGGGEAAVQAFHCVAPQGVAYRARPDFSDRTDAMLRQGEVVQVLEHWVKTTHGWLPVTDQSGAPLLERARDSRSSTKTEERRAEPRAEPAREDRREEPRRSRRVAGLAEEEAAPTAATPVAPPPAAAPAASAEAAPASVAEIPSPQRHRVSAAAAPARRKASKEAPKEASVPEVWKGVHARLLERFPNAGAAKVLQALEASDGHAGQAASRLRDA